MKYPRHIRELLFVTVVVALTLAIIAKNEVEVTVPILESGSAGAIEFVSSISDGTNNADEGYGRPSVFSSDQSKPSLDFLDPTLESFLEVLNTPMKWVEQPTTAVLIREAWEREGGYLIPTLVSLLDHEDREVRVMTAQLLGGLNQTDVISPLTNRLKKEKDEWVACALMAGLANCGDRPGHWASVLEKVYLERWTNGGQPGEPTAWRLALLIGSVQGPEFDSAIEAICEHTDGALGPVVFTCAELRSLYWERKTKPL